MADEFEIFENMRNDRTYLSKSFGVNDFFQNDPNVRKGRFISKVFDSGEIDEFVENSDSDNADVPSSDYDFLDF